MKTSLFSGNEYQFHRGHVHMASLKRVIQTAKLRYQSWARRVRIAFDELEPNDRLENLSNELSKGSTVMIFGAGMSTVTGRFNQVWELYREDIEAQPSFWDDMDDVFAFGAIPSTPRVGLGVLPDIVRKGHIPAMLVFNYNCHIETCLRICNVDYQSLVYDGKTWVEVLTSEEPECQIFKPHGSYRFSGGRTQIVLPGRKPANEHVLQEFVRLAIERKVRNIAIIGWSGNQDDYVREYLKNLLEKSREDIVNVVHIDLEGKDPTELATHSWGILTENPVLLKGGGNDALIGLARKLDVAEACCSVQRPHNALLENLDSLKQKPTRVKI